MFTYAQILQNEAVAEVSVMRSVPAALQVTSVGGQIVVKSLDLEVAKLQR